jgi:bacteriocin biosynthesis cyclodehydratase domain-containing protein
MPQQPRTPKGSPGSLQLDPRLPLVWRTPQSLQFGVDRPAVVLDPVSGPEERMIAALVTGVTRPGLGVVADGAGADTAQVDALLHRITPALRAQGLPAGQNHDVSVTGCSLTAERVRAALVDATLSRPSAEATAPAVRSPSLAVIVAHYVIDPEDQSRWLRRDVPHLPIVVSDAGVHIGPIIEPGTGPCLHCLERHRTDADAAWPAIAAQLWGRVSHIESAALALEVAGAVVRLVAARLEAGPGVSSLSTTLDAATGTRTTREWHPHPECGCAALPGSGSAIEHLNAGGTIPPMRGGASAWRA